MYRPMPGAGGIGGASDPENSLSETGRAYPGLDMKHGFLRDIRQTQIQRLQADGDADERKADAARMARSVGRARKAARPSLQIYRPPGARAAEAAEREAQLVAQRAAKNEEASRAAAPGPSSSRVQSVSAMRQPDQRGGSATFRNRSHAMLTGGQPVLAKREELSTGASVNATGARRHDLHQAAMSKVEQEAKSLFLPMQSCWYTEDDDVLPPATEPTTSKGAKELLRMVLGDAASMSKQELVALTDAILEECLGGLETAKTTAKLCLRIIENGGGDVFLDAMVTTSLRKIFRERESIVTDLEGPTGVPRRWISFLEFITQLFMQLSDIAGNFFTAVTADYRSHIAGIIVCSCLFCLRPPALGHPAELDWLRSVLQHAAPTLQEDIPNSAEVVMNHIRKAFVQPSCSPSSRKKLMDLITLNASTWKIGS